jgi:hypothetical protein
VQRKQRGTHKAHVCGTDGYAVAVDDALHDL